MTRGPYDKEGGALAARPVVEPVSNRLEVVEPVSNRLGLAQPGDLAQT